MIYSCGYFTGILYHIEGIFFYANFIKYYKSCWILLYIFSVFVEMIVCFKLLIHLMYCVD